MKNKNFFTLFFIATLSLLTFYSCSSDDDASGTEDTPVGISISVDKNNLTSTSEEFFTFNVVTDEGDDVTSESSIYVNETLIEGNTFTTTEVGSYSAYAQLQDEQSSSISFSVSEEPISYYKHKVLIEDFTGTWCGWCPLVLNTLEELEGKPEAENIIVAALHLQDGYDLTPSNQKNALISWNGVSDGQYIYVPKVYFNRTHEWISPQYSYSDLENDLFSMINTSSPFGIAISSDLNQTEGSVNVKFEFSEDISEPIKYVVYIAENGIIEDQENYTEHYNGSHTIPDFEHDHAVRTIANDNILGTDISAENRTKENGYEVSLSANYTSKNSANLEIIVLILDQEGSVLNAQVAPANTTKDFEVVE